MAEGNSVYHSEGNCLIETASKTLIAGCKNSVIPTDGSVTSIGGSSFSGCSNLTSIVIPEGVTSIGNRAFSQCSSLTSIEIPESVKSIGNGAFGDCSSLTSIEIPEGVTSIGNSAFYNCSSLTSIDIPFSVTSIGSSTFFGCSRLKSIMIWSWVTSIGSGAFSGCSSLTSIDIPSSVKRIGDSAFSGCSRLVSITIFSRSVVIYDSDYRDTIPTATTICGYAGSDVQAYAEEHGNWFVALSEEEPHDHVYSAWKKYSGAQHMRICTCGDVEYADHTWDDGQVTTEPTSSSQGVKTYTCTACGATKTETIPPTTIYSGTCGAEGDNLTWTFDSSTGTLTISGTGDMADYSSDVSVPWNSYRSSIQAVEIAEGVTSIGNYAFYQCSSLTSIEIPSSVMSIGNYAFYWCSSLTSIEISSNVTSIGNYAFYQCSNLTSIKIPSSVMSIGNRAFSYCSSLTSIEIPSSVMSIGDSAFNGCSELREFIVDEANEFYQSIDGILFSEGGATLICYPIGKTDDRYVIPSSVTSIGYNAFSNCDSLTSIEIPSSVTSIGDSAFSYCGNLTSIEIPSSVTSIGDNAFNRGVGVLWLQQSGHCHL